MRKTLGCSLSIAGTHELIWSGTLRRCTIVGEGMALMEEVHHCRGRLRGLIHTQAIPNVQFTYSFLKIKMLNSQLPLQHDGPKLIDILLSWVLSFSLFGTMPCLFMCYFDNHWSRPYLSFKYFLRNNSIQKVVLQFLNF